MKECYLEINEDHLKSNFEWYKSQTNNSFICPMVKANAYGIGDSYIVKMLLEAGTKWVGVVRLSEAMGIRKLDSTVGILLFNPCDVEEYKSVIAHDITPVISNFAGLAALKEALIESGELRFRAHFEVDTGMNRLGFKASDLDELFRRLKEHNKICVSGVFTHLYHSEDWPKDDGKTHRQLTMFEALKHRFEKYQSELGNGKSEQPIIFHVSNSRAVNDAGLSDPKNKILQQYGFRPGLGLYGVSQACAQLKTVLSVKAPIIALKWIEKGETVSYDGIWEAQRRSLIGTIPIGYADGYPRSLSNKFFVLIRGKKAPVVGKICMDFMMVDLTEFANDVDSLSSGAPSDLTSTETMTSLLNERVLIFGEQGSDKISLDHLAECAGMISYEVLTGLSSRMKRIVVEKST